MEQVRSRNRRFGRGTRDRGRDSQHARCDVCDGAGNVVAGNDSDRVDNAEHFRMPNIFAVGADGKVAEGCRAVEAIRVIHDLDSLFDNLRSARERLRKGIVASDAVKRSLENTNANQKTTARLEVRIDTNPLRPAEIRYVREHGAEHFNQFLEMLLEELFPAM